MTVKELIEILSKQDPNMEVHIEAPVSDYYETEYVEYELNEKDIDCLYGVLTIGVG